MRGRAMLFAGVRQVVVETVHFPDPLPGEAVVETLYSSVSPGTELRCLNGTQPDSPPYPYIPGYSSVGRVVAVGEGVTMPIGTLVFAGGTEHADHAILWGAHSSHVVKDAGKLIPIPDGIDPRDAVLAKLAAIAYHGVRISRAQPHETVMVVGLGVIGQLSARLHHLTGARVVAFDRAAGRVAFAGSDGGIEANVVTDSAMSAAREILPEGADVLVDATGVPAVLGEVARFARDLPWNDTPHFPSRLLIQGSYPADVPLPYQHAFMKELTIHVPRDNQPRDIVTALDLMRRRLLRVDDLAGQITTPDHAPEVYEALGRGDMLTAIFDWTAKQ